jgi:hypothetical protein
LATQQTLSSVKVVKASSKPSAILQQILSLGYGIVNSDKFFFKLKSLCRNLPANQISYLRIYFFKLLIFSMVLVVVELLAIL